MSEITVTKPIYKILNQSTSFPYTTTRDVSGLSIVNDGVTDVTAVITK